MIEETQVAHAHGVAHEVASLVITHAVPVFGLFGSRLEMVNAKHIGFGFQEPMVHGGFMDKVRSA